MAKEQQENTSQDEGEDGKPRTTSQKWARLQKIKERKIEVKEVADDKLADLDREAVQIKSDLAKELEE